MVVFYLGASVPTSYTTSVDANWGFDSLPAHQPKFDLRIRSQRSATTLRRRFLGPVDPLADSRVAAALSLCRF